MNRLALALSVCIWLSSCEKNIEIKMNSSSPVLVVDAEIESGKEPRVVLTKSFSYYEQLSVQGLMKSYVHNAEVYIQNGSHTQRLKEYSYELFPGVNGFYYGIDTIPSQTPFKGEMNTDYTLKIVAEGKEYLAQTSIPALNLIPDSIYFKHPPLNPDSNKRVMMVKITDPPGLGNYIRYYTKSNTDPFLPGFNSVFSDEVIDGTTVTVQLDPGVDRNKIGRPEPSERFFFKGDTITIKYCNINRSSYLFWNTWEYSQQSIGNPFSQPIKVIGNISNGALGSFCGYAAWQKSYIVD
jgi:hypothetical protein